MRRLLAVAFLLSSLALAQSTSTQTSGAAQSDTQAAGQSTERGGPDMRSDAAQMRRNLEALKTAVNKMDEGPGRDAALANVKMWEGLVSHMERMTAMSGHHGMGRDRSMSGRGAPMGGATNQRGSQGKEATSPKGKPETDSKPVEPQ